MPKVIFLVGLCGAGKTRKAKQMEQDEGYVFVEGFESDVPKYQLMVNSLRRGKNCVAEEFKTVFYSYKVDIESRLRRDTQIPDLEVKFWYFERDIVKATKNVLSRPDDKKVVADHLIINGRIFDQYLIPPDLNTVILPIEPPTQYVDP